MNLFTAPEVIKNYAAAGKKKTELSVFRMLVLGILAGMFIALGAAVTNTAAHTITAFPQPVLSAVFCFRPFYRWLS